jgi:PAS domain-containing protein
MLSWLSARSPEQALHRLHVANVTLQESEERHRVISELTSDIAYAVRVEPDGSTTPEWWVGALTRITGFTDDELVARGD